MREYTALYMSIYENTCKYTYDMYKYKYIFFTQVCFSLKHCQNHFLTVLKFTKTTF